jgi:hypothetical protein
VDVLVEIFITLLSCPLQLALELQHPLFQEPLDSSSHLLTLNNYRVRAKGHVEINNDVPHYLSKRLPLALIKIKCEENKNIREKTLPRKQPKSEK